MNRVILSGRLTKDIDVRFTQTGKCVANFSLAVNKKDNVNFFNVVVWDKLAEICGNNLGKGSKVLIEGELSTRSYEDSSGTKKTVTEVVAYNVEFMGSKNDIQQTPQQKTTQQVPQHYNTFGAVQQNEEIPF
jgi:single-strand DNA-binding protein|nr:MAG TPA: Single strand binding protein [Caudoviricetes sp.]